MNPVREDSKKAVSDSVFETSLEAVSSSGASLPFSTETHRSLKPRHVQLIGIGGTIGTVLFVQIGSALTKGGPVALFVAFAIWCIPIFFITALVAEMVSYLPLPSPFITMSGRVIDEAFEVTQGWNFFLFEAALIPFEITAVNIILKYWDIGGNTYSPGIPLAIQVVLYAAINIFAVEYYGETEYWLAIGKVLLAVGLIFFTFITMVGGNPDHDRYGFRNWIHIPFAEYNATGSWGRFLGFFACLIQAAFTIAGPEYVSMSAGEAIRPRQTLPSVFKAVFYRLTIFFVMGVFCVGIVVRCDDPMLLNAIKEGHPGASASPYVIAMINLGISSSSFLPNLVNALILTSAFSAGNSYTYCSSRTLYGLSLRGHAPKIFSYCTKKGNVPVFAVLVSLMFALLSFLQLSESSEKVLNWIVNLVTASQLINFIYLCITYLHFKDAFVAQNLDRSMLPFKIPDRFKPKLWAKLCICCFFIMLLLAGYESFLDGFHVANFLFQYIMILINVLIYIAWKLIMRTDYKKDPKLRDITTGLEQIIEEEKESLRSTQSIDQEMGFFRKAGKKLLKF